VVNQKQVAPRPPLLLHLSIGLMACAIGCSTSSSQPGNDAGGDAGVSEGDGSAAFCALVLQGEPACVAHTNVVGPVRSAILEECTSGGGALVTTCPAAALLGCCTEPSAADGGDVIEACYYQDDAGEFSASTLQASCTSDGGSPGTWSTTP
jgi:hypothetical protein